MAESHLTRRLFGSMVRRIEALAAPAGEGLALVGEKIERREEADTDRCARNRLNKGQFPGFGLPGRAGMAFRADGGLTRIKIF